MYDDARSNLASFLTMQNAPFLFMLGCLTGKCILNSSSPAHADPHPPHRHAEDDS